MAIETRRSIKNRLKRYEMRVRSILRKKKRTVEDMENLNRYYLMMGEMIDHLEYLEED